MKKLLFIVGIFGLSVLSTQGAEHINEVPKRGKMQTDEFKKVLQDRHKGKNLPKKSSKLIPLYQRKARVSTLRDISDPDKLVVSKEELQKSLDRSSKQIGDKLDDIIEGFGKVKYSNASKGLDVEEVNAELDEIEKKNKERNKKTSEMIERRRQLPPPSKNISTLSLIFKHKKSIFISFLVVGAGLYLLYYYVKSFQKVPPPTDKEAKVRPDGSDIEIKGRKTTNDDQGPVVENAKNNEDVVIPKWLKYLFKVFSPFEGISYN